MKESLLCTTSSIHHLQVSLWLSGGGGGEAAVLACSCTHTCTDWCWRGWYACMHAGQKVVEPGEVQHISHGFKWHRVSLITVIQLSFPPFLKFVPPVLNLLPLQCAIHNINPSAHFYCLQRVSIYGMLSKSFVLLASAERSLKMSNRNSFTVFKTGTLGQQKTDMH